MKENKLLYFKYQLHHGSVPINVWIQLVGYRILLVIKRILRFFKRVAIYLKTYIPMLLCVILFEIITIPIGINLEKYDSWFDGLWDLREFMLTSIIIAIVVGIFSMEIKRHKELGKQYWTYQSFKCASDNFISSLCRVVDFSVEEDIFLHEENFDSFYLKLQEKIESDLPVIKNPIMVDRWLVYSTKELPRIIAIKIYFEQYLRALDSFNREIITRDFEGTIEHAIGQIDHIYNEIKAESLLIEDQKSDYTDIQLLKFVDCIARGIYPAIADIRRPWRWDIDINNKMKELIKSCTVDNRNGGKRMKFIKKNTFEKVCDWLDEEYDASNNEYTYTKNYLKERYIKDLDALWKLKAEARDMSFLDYTSFKVAMLALLYTCADFYMGNDMEIATKIIYTIILLGVTVLLLRKSKFQSVSKWRKYVLGAIEEIEREIYSTDNKSDKKD